MNPDRSAREVAGYDRLARPYRLLEYCLFRRQLERARESMLERLPRVDRVLILGDGDGRFLRRFCLDRPASRVTSVDYSEQMLRRQRARVAGPELNDRVRWLQSDARTYRPQVASFDLLVTHFFLDCFSAADLRTHLPDWLAAVRPGGWFYFVDFVRPSSGWRRVRGDLYLGSMHRLFRWQTGLPNRRLVDLDAILAEQPIRELHSRTFSHGLITARLYQKV